MTCKIETIHSLYVSNCYSHDAYPHLTLALDMFICIENLFLHNSYRITLTDVVVQTFSQPSSISPIVHIWSCTHPHIIHVVVINGGGGGGNIFWM